MEPLTWHAIGAIWVVGTLAIIDLRYRIAPNPMTLTGIVTGIAVGGLSSLSLAMIVLTVMVYAGFPGGDCKGAAAMAAWVPYSIFLPAFVITLVVTLIIMETGWYNLYQRAHRWAWLAGLSLALTISAICAMLRGT